MRGDRKTPGSLTLMQNTKLTFLLEEFPRLLLTLKADAPGKWGVMNAQQMVEHFIEAVLVAAGKIAVPQLTPEEKLPSMKAFLFSDKPFQENTKNPLLKETPPAPRLADMEAAVSELQRAFEAFIDSYKADPSKEIINPFFGPLDFAGQQQLLHKHALHHLRQFGIEA